MISVIASNGSGPAKPLLPLPLSPGGASWGGGLPRNLPGDTWWTSSLLTENVQTEDQESVPEIDTGQGLPLELEPSQEGLSPALIKVISQCVTMLTAPCQVGGGVYLSVGGGVYSRAGRGRGQGARSLHIHHLEERTGGPALEAVNEGKQNITYKDDATSVKRTERKIKSKEVRMDLRSLAGLGMGVASILTILICVGELEEQ